MFSTDPAVSSSIFVGAEREELIVNQNVRFYECWQKNVRRTGYREAKL